MACRLFVEVAPDTLGLVHNSELEVAKFGSVTDWEVGDTLDVKVMSVSLYCCKLKHPQAFALRSLPGTFPWRGRFSQEDRRDRIGTTEHDTCKGIVHCVCKATINREGGRTLCNF